MLLSEKMLQQTQVARVVERYPVLLERFPTPAACAAAGVGAVIGSWAGLGYNRRARDLHRAAERIVEVHDGRVPDRLAELLALPGVGPYTARAVLVFAFEQPYGVLDTNVGRVLARAWSGRPLGRAEAQHLADELAADTDPWTWNQALLDLGALVCRPRAPRCGACPVQPACTWAGVGGDDPAVSSAGVSTPQAPFEGSDRQARGRVVAALRVGPVTVRGVRDVVGGPTARAARVVESLVRDGLAERDGDVLRLPR